MLSIFVVVVLCLSDVLPSFFVFPLAFRKVLPRSCLEVVLNTTEEINYFSSTLLIWPDKGLQVVGLDSELFNQTCGQSRGSLRKSMK